MEIYIHGSHLGLLSKEKVIFEITFGYFFGVEVELCDVLFCNLFTVHDYHLNLLNLTVIISFSSTFVISGNLTFFYNFIYEIYHNSFP